MVADTGAYELVRAVGDLMAYNPDDPDYDVRRVITLLVTGLRQHQGHQDQAPPRADPDPTGPPAIRPC